MTPGEESINSCCLALLSFSSARQWDKHRAADVLASSDGQSSAICDPGDRSSTTLVSALHGTAHARLNVPLFPAQNLSSSWSLRSPSGRGVASLAEASSCRRDYLPAARWWGRSSSELTIISWRAVQTTSRTWPTTASGGWCIVFQVTAALWRSSKRSGPAWSLMLRLYRGGSS